MHEDAQLRRRDPIAYQANIVARQRQQEVEYRQKYPHAYPQPLSHPYDQVQPPSYPDKFRHFVPASGYGSPSSITPGGHAYPMVPNQYNRPVPSSNPANMDAAPLEPGETYTAPTLQTSNVVPVLGANTTRWDRSRSPEKQSAEIIHAPEAGSEPHADGMDVETNGPALNDPIAPVEQSRASEDATVEFPAPDNSTNTPSAEIGTVPTTANNASIPNPPLTEGPATPSPAPTLKRKLSPSATDSGRKQHKSRPGFGFPALNNLFRRESSRNGDNQTT